jgi:hypothetical protein
MTMNLLNNSLLDNNLLSYVIIATSIGILGYSIYYFNFNFFNSKIIKDLPNLNDSETMTHSIVNNLKNQSITGSDTLVPNLKNETLDSLMKIESTVQTEPIVTTTVDSGVQTDIKLLYDYLQELLYNNSDPVTSFGEISPTEFAELIANDPQGPAYLNHIQKWVDNVAPSSSSSSSYGSHTSEINFIKQVLESMKSNLSSPIENTSNIIPQFNIESIRETKLNEILKYINDKYPTTTSDPFITDWIKGIVDQYDYLQLLSTVCQTEIINKINCNIIIWSCGIF